MKAHQFATTPSLGEGLLHARWFNILVVEFELFFGIWLIFGMLPKLTWLVTVGCFSIFALVSFSKAVFGENSCGCFGAAIVNPRITCLFDIVIILMLIRFRPKIEFPARSSLLANIPKREFTLYLGISLCIGGSVYGWITQMRWEQLSNVGQILKYNTIQLEPVAWAGKEFPLRDHVTDGKKLMDGDWFVLLSRSGCDDCERVKKEIIDPAACENRLIALLNITDDRSTASQNEKLTNAFRFVKDIDWIVETPVLLDLRNGIVRKVYNRRMLLNMRNDKQLFTVIDLPEETNFADGRH